MPDAPIQKQEFSVDRTIDALQARGSDALLQVREEGWIGLRRFLSQFRLGALRGHRWLSSASKQRMALVDCGEVSARSGSSVHTLCITKNTENTENIGTLRYRIERAISLQVKFTQVIASGRVENLARVETGIAAR